MNLSQATSRIAAHLPSENVAGFPIALIIELITALLPVLLNHCKPATAAVVAHDKLARSAAVEFKVRKVVNRKFGNALKIGVKKHDALMHAAMDALFEAADQSTADEISQLCESVNQQS